MMGSTGQTNIENADAAKSGTNSSYDNYLKVGFFLIFSLIAGFLAWSVFAPIQGAVLAPGSVVVEGKPKTLQHLAGGIVVEILVQDGDKVKEGDVVMKLDPTSLTANRDLLKKRLAEAKARAARLKSERDELRRIDWDAIFPDSISKENAALIIEDQTKLFNTRRQAYIGEIDQLNKQIEQSRQQVSGLNSQIEANNNQITLIERELTSLKSLLEQGYVSQTRVLALEREQAGLIGQIANFTSDIARTNTAIGEIEIQILQVKRVNQEAVLTELRASESEINDLSEQLITAQNDVEEIDIVTPVSGTVHNMAITTIGGVVSSAEPIMDIIPDTGKLIIETQVEPASIDQIYIGQPTTVRLSAFNQRTTPELNGNVVSISANTLVDPVSGFPFYTVKITLPENELARLNGLVLVPGMPAEAFMQTDERTVVNYLLKPATDQLNRAFKEE